MARGGALVAVVAVVVRVVGGGDYGQVAEDPGKTMDRRRHTTGGPVEGYHVTGSLHNLCCLLIARNWKGESSHPGKICMGWKVEVSFEFPTILR